MKDGKRRQLSALEIDMAIFLKDIIKKSDERVADGWQRDKKTQAQYDEAKVLVSRFEKIAEETGYHA